MQIEDKAVRYIAKAADGSMRDALSLLDQCIAFHFGQELTYDKVLDVLGAVDTEVFSRLFRTVLDGNVTGAIGLLEEIVMQGRELTQFVADFTWYLRNLLLVKTADGIEDIIDVSTENLARLKEEAKMAENDVIMRYIRILSELSGQLRFAAQKRILIEMNLIKLCRPSMETDIQSLTDRIRQLEEKIANGVPMMAATAASASGTQKLQEPVVRAPLPAAIPQDIQDAVNKWSAIVTQAPMPMKAYLKTAYPSLAGDGSMLVVVEDGLPSDYFKEAGRKEELEHLISDFAGKEIKVTMQKPETGRNPREVFPDLTQLVDQKINMEIEEIEDDAEEF